MSEFFFFVISLVEEFVNFLMSLPLMISSEFSFSLGEFLVAVAIMGILLSAIVESVLAFNSSPESRISDKSSGNGG